MGWHAIKPIHAVAHGSQLGVSILRTELVPQIPSADSSFEARRIGDAFVGGKGFVEIRFPRAH